MEEKKKKNRMWRDIQQKATLLETIVHEVLNIVETIIHQLR